MDRVKDLSEIITERPSSTHLAKALAISWQYLYPEEMDYEEDGDARRRILHNQARRYNLNPYLMQS